MSVITKQLIINHFDLPTEANDIIKEFAFHDVYQKTKQTKNRLIELINNTFDCPIRCGPLHPTRYIFCMNEDYNSLQFQSTFCLKCGDFTFPIPRVASHNVKCNCH